MNKIIILVTVILVTNFTTAYGFEWKVNPAPNFGWSVQTFFEDVKETFEFDPLKKAQIQAEHAEKAQKEIERLTNNAEPIPVELINRVDTKLEDAEKNQQQGLENPNQDQGILDKITDATDSVISTVRQVSEVNEIRQLAGEYTVLGDRVRNNEIMESDAKAIAEQLDQRTNRLETFKQNCWKPISSYELAVKENPYQELQEICPALKKHNFEEAKKLLDTLP